MPINLDPFIFNRVLDVTNRFPERIDLHAGFGFVKFDYLKTNQVIIDGFPYITNHYPVDDVIAGVNIRESELKPVLDDIRKIQTNNLIENINSVLFHGIFKSRTNGDIDWYKNKLFTPLEMTLEDAEEYFKDSGFLKTHLEKRFIPDDCDRSKRDLKIEKILVPRASIPIVSVKFSPANRFSTVNTTAKEIYAFAYPNFEKDETELMCESNYIVVLEQPELIVRITD